MWPAGEAVPRPDSPGLATLLDQTTLARILEGLPRRPLLAGEGLASGALSDLMDHIRGRCDAVIAIAELSSAKFMDRFDEDIAADRFNRVALAAQDFRACQPAVSRYTAARLADRIFRVHPAFAREAHVEAWTEAEPQWRERIGQFATDPARLGDEVRGAIRSLQAFA